MLMKKRKKAVEISETVRPLSLIKTSNNNMVWRALKQRKLEKLLLKPKKFKTHSTLTEFHTG